jgi:hypothetical protein
MPWTARRSSTRLSGPVFFAELNDGFRGGWSNPGQFLELFDGRRVQVNWMSRRLFLCRSCREHEQRYRQDD